MSTKVEIVVLGLLAEEPMYGYDLLERFRERGMGFWTELSRASVYQVLKRLERDGLATGKTQEGREGPDRRVYRITRAGRDRLAEGLEPWRRGWRPTTATRRWRSGSRTRCPPAPPKPWPTRRERTVLDLLDGVRTELDRTASARDAGRAVSNAMLRQQEALAEAELAWLRTYRVSIGKLRR